MADENQNQNLRQYKLDAYNKLEKSFVSYADLTAVTALDIAADTEPFVTLAAYGHGLIGKYIAKRDIENVQKQNIIARESVYKKLQKADAALKNKNENWQLVVVYGYRSPGVQQRLFNTELERTQNDNPALDYNEIIETVHRRVAVPSVSGQPTGGAVDVTVYDFVKGSYLDFGTDVRDFSTKDSYYNSPFISREQKENRSYLRKVMTAEDFAPYDGEWWHFSYGDKEWAFYSRRQARRNKLETTDLKYLYAHKLPAELVYTDKYRDSAAVEQAGLVRLAIQKSGRLTEETVNILKKSGIDVDYGEGKFFGKCGNFPLEILFVRDDDIPGLVDAGAADAGIVGQNIYEESDCKSVILKELGFGRCALAVAVPEFSGIQSIFDLSGKKVATSYNRSAGKFFERENILNVGIVPLSGAVEMAPTIGYADAIIDLVSTGSSLRQNKLKFLHKIFDSESVLIANKAALDNKEKHSTIDRLISRITGYLSAKSYKRVMFSVRKERLEAIKPALASAKLANLCDSLADSEYSIVRAVVKKSSIWDIIEELKKNGAEDIVFYDIESIM